MGSRTTINSSKWIANGAIKTDEKYNPILTLIYLPHLDYNLQRYGLDFSKIFKDLREIDEVVEQLVSHYEQKGAKIILLSEYGITNVKNPIHLNRILRKEGFVKVRIERGLELLDAGASEAFAVADHQVAHIYVKDSVNLDKVKAILTKVPGVERVLDKNEIEKENLNHERCGDLVVVANSDSWFTYYFWLDDAVAPDYAVNGRYS
ncbi:alkaline phosphatase family protein [Maribacter litopenaei]|uniref:Alkaline phosphatase family protein n=1 Tax=Maribacter litopenaei TaxID=2976127 RepID=A0ABY5Y4L8_9FLAO|nr:alkaline phosphatase family protein [Maribacter litopenaei]UWX53953.1 alkaline phosphatase family protein [Maribacter litopenaei]